MKDVTYVSRDTSLC